MIRYYFSCQVLALVVFSFLIHVPAEAIPNPCPAAFAELAQEAHGIIQALAANQTISPDLAVAQSKYESHFNEPGFTDFLNPAQVYRLLTNGHLPYYVHMLRMALDDLDAHAATEPGPLVDRIRNSFRRVLTGRVPERTIESRLAAGASDLSGLYNLLGDMTLEETQELVYGADPLHPSPESLLGKYLAETGAATLVRGFSTVPNQPNDPNVGPARLVVAVSEASFPQFQKYIMRPDLFSIHGHAFVGHNGKLFSYQHQGVDFRLPSVGYVLPEILIKTSESQRLRIFFNLLNSELAAGKGYSVNNRAMHPWSIPGYLTAPGGYVNCTHWIANMPIGDRMVQTYRFPPNVEANRGAGPIESTTRPYPSNEPLVHMAWKTPGHEQLADVLGIGSQNVLGNLASPGYLIQTMLSTVPVGRLPVVFYVTADHRAAIPQNFNYTVENAN